MSPVQSYAWKWSHFHDFDEKRFAQALVQRFCKWKLRRLKLKSACTIFLFYKNVVFPAQAEYSYFSADFGLKTWHFRFRIYWGINYKCLVFRSVLRYIVHVLHRFFHCSHWGLNVTSNDTGYSMMETKEPDFVSTMSRTIKCSKLLVNQQGLFYTVKKTKENCIVFTDASTHKIISILFKNLSLGFILKIILKISQISASIFL